MGRVVRGIVGAVAIVAGAVVPGLQFLVPVGISLVGGAILERSQSRRRDAQAATLQTGEVARQAIFGRTAEAGSLVDAFNYGGKYGTDWEVLVIALADHRCDALEGFFVNDEYVAFGGDGAVAGFSGQLEVYWRDGQFDQAVPAILTTHGPGWTANDRGRGVAYVVVAYKADDEKAKVPIWEGRRPTFRWVVRGLRCYQARKDTTVGGSGAHRRDNPATWEWTENPIDVRYNWVRGIYAGDQVANPAMLLVGRGLSAIEAPPQNVFSRANLCDEVVDGAPRYRIGGLVSADEAYIEVESDIAAACAGVIVQPEGAVEINPGEARAPVAHFTDDDLIVGSKVSWSEFLGSGDNGWTNTVVARFVDPLQRWAMRGAPVRRDTADIIADGGPREKTLQLSLVTNVEQSGRVAEIARRFGRLWARGTVTLPPRFAGIEEGDWVTWTSARWFGGATRTFQVEAWGSDQGWRHQLTLRQISASVFSDTAPLDDGVIAAPQTPPAALSAPLIGAWALSATQINAGSLRVPALLVIGEVDDPAAQFVIFEFVQQSAAPGSGTQWTLAGASRPDVTRLSIAVPSGGTHYMAVSYVIDGVTTPRRVLGPVTLAEFAYPNGISFRDLQPSELGANVTESRTAAFIQFQGDLATRNAATLPFGANAAINTDFARGTFGWASSAPQFQVNEPGFFGQRNVVRVGRNGASPDGQLTEAFYSDALFPGRPVANAPRFALPVKQGDRIFGRALLARWNATCGVRLLVFNGAGTLVQSRTDVGGLLGGGQDGDPANFQEVTSFMDVTPADAAWAILAFRMFGTGFDNPRIYIAEPMIAKVAAGQTAIPPYSPGLADRLSDPTGENTAAFVQGQTGWATWPGLTPAVLETNLANAQNDAAASLADLTAIASDGVVTVGEKISVRERRDNIIAEFPVWRDRGIDFNITASIRTNYQAAYDQLIAYLIAINLNANSNSNVVRADFVAAFNNYAIWRERVIEAISVVASQRATWATVTGTGRPENNADVTAGRTAAFVAGQGDLATRNAASLPFGANAAINTDFARGTFGWAGDAGPVDFGIGNLFTGLTGQRNTWQYRRNETLAAGVFAVALHPNALRFGAPLANAPRLALPVRQGDRVFVRALLARYRCLSQVQLRVYDRLGNLTESQSQVGGRLNGGQNGDPANFDEISFFRTLSNTDSAWAVLAIRIEGTGELNPVVIVSEPMIAKVAPDQTAIPPYVPGSPDPLGDNTVEQPVVGLLNPANGRAISRRINSQIITSGVLGTFNVNPLSASTSGSVSTITINAHTVFDDVGSTAYTAASIGGLVPGTMYFVYESNPDFVGGARTYVATTNRNALTVFGRRFVGAVTTPATGSPPSSGGGGGGGFVPGDPNVSQP